MAEQQTGYDAFLSYSHEDAATARSLCSELENFGRSYLQSRRFRIWRDDSSLRMTASLQTAIDGALAQSNHLLVLLSPDAMGSLWVAREVRLFVETHGVDRVGLLLTRGSTPWTPRSEEPPLVLEPALSPLLGDGREPLVIDLRPFRAPDGTLQRSAALTNRLAAVAAALANTAKDEIYGEHIRALRSRIIGLGALAAALLAAVIFAVVQARATARSSHEQQAAYAEVAAERGGNERAALDSALRAAGWGLSLPRRNASIFEAIWEPVVRNYSAPNPVFMRALAAGIAGIVRGRTIAHHGGDANSAVYSLDGKRVVTASGDCTVCVLNLPSRRCEPELTRKRAQGWAEFGEDGASVLVAEGSAVIAWDAALNEPSWEIETSADSIRRFHRCHDLLLTEDGRHVQLWNWRSRRRLQTLNGHVASVSHDSTTLAVYLPPRIVVYGIGDGGVLTERSTFDAIGHVTALGVSRDGTQVVAGMLDGQVFVWDVQGQELTYRLQGHSGSINDVAFSNDALRMVTASSDGTARVWDPSSGALIATLQQHDRILTARFAPDELHVLSASSDGDVRLASLVDTETVLDVQQDAPERFPEAQSSTSPPRSALFSRDTQHIFVIDGHGVLSRWRRDGTPGSEILVEHALAVAEAQNGQVVSVTTAGEVVRGSRRLMLTTGPLRGASLSSSGRYACLADVHGHSHLIDTESGREPIPSWSTPRNAIPSVISDPITAIVGDDNSIDVLRNETGELIQHFDTHKGTILALTLGSRVISSSADGKLLVWDPHSGHVLLERRYAASITRIVLTRDGERALLLDAARVLHVLDLSKRHELDSDIAREGIWDAEWSPDGTRFITRARAGKSSLWAVGFREPLAHYNTLSTINALAFSPDGDHALVLGYDGRAFVLPASARQFVRQACALAQSEQLPQLYKDYCDH